jgi:hypothetical protein
MCNGRATGEDQVSLLLANECNRDICEDDTTKRQGAAVSATHRDNLSLLGQNVSSAALAIASDQQCFLNRAERNTPGNHVEQLCARRRGEAVISRRFTFGSTQDR